MVIYIYSLFLSKNFSRQVADELVQEFSDPDKHLSPTDQVLVPLYVVIIVSVLVF